MMNDEPLDTHVGLQLYPRFELTLVTLARIDTLAPRTHGRMGRKPVDLAGKVRNQG